MFLDTDFLKNDEIQLVLEKTQDGDEERNWVPAYHFFICDLGGTRMGVCDLRIGYNDNLYYGGHIGYRVSPEYRGNHYAGKACLLLFQLARKHDMEYLYITCNPDNYASRKTCEYAGGKLLEVVELPEGNDMRDEGEFEKCIYKFSLVELSPANQNIEIYPLDRAVIDGVSIYLGMEQAAVEAAIGKGELAGNRYYYYNNEMAIDYSGGKVEFIEFLGGIDGILHPWIYGVSAFDTSADELIKILKQKNDGEVDDSEQGYSFAFLDISVGVYRELRPSDVEEMIEEMKADGISADNNEDVQKEMRKANHWSTIGIGAAGYYQKIPFEVSRDIPNAETEEALEEVRLMKQNQYTSENI